MSQSYSASPPDTDWISSMDGDNFLAIYDVLLDIERELNVAVDEVLGFPLMPHAVRFSGLFPGYSISMRDRYLEIRYKALQFLQSKGLVRRFELDDSHGHRWDTRVNAVVDEGRCRATLAAMREEHQRRQPAPSRIPDDATIRVRIALSRFHLLAVELGRRRESRETIRIEDEYDVQDLLRGVLALFFDDVRPEEPTPSHAGKPARMDFFLKESSIVIEAKMARRGHTEKQIGDELLLDVARYRTRSDCQRLFCLVYDPGYLIRNPRGLEADVAASAAGFPVEVLIVPRSH